jgi:hypothetical protein
MVVFLSVFLVVTYLLMWFGPLVKSWFSWSMAMDTGIYPRVMVLGSWTFAFAILVGLAAAMALLLAIFWDVGKLVRKRLRTMPRMVEGRSHRHARRLAGPCGFFARRHPGSRRPKSDRWRALDVR